jgi:Fic family protein
MSMRLLRGMHKVLMSHPGGRGKTPGEVRRSQVWIGGTRPGNAAFVPPPAGELTACLMPLERFLNDEPEPTPPLLKAALAHVQFETIHPFLDGNGRIGRLLIVLQLVADGVLREPMLYPSLFFRTHRRAASSALAVQQALQRQPITTSNALARETGLTPATVNKSLAHLERLKVVTELTNRRRGRVFAYKRYVDELSAELDV